MYVYVHLASHTHTHTWAYTIVLVFTCASHLAGNHCLSALSKAKTKTRKSGNQHSAAQLAVSGSSSVDRAQVSDRIIVVVVVGYTNAKRLTRTQRHAQRQTLAHTHTQVTRYILQSLRRCCCLCRRRRRCRRLLPSQEADLKPVCRIFTKTEFSLEAFGGVEGVCKSAIRCLTPVSAGQHNHRA